MLILLRSPCVGIPAVVIPSTVSAAAHADRSGRGDAGTRLA
jgi:hypothetical protein